MYTSLQYLDIFTGCLSKPEFPKKLHASVSMLSPPPTLLISLTFYICPPLLDLFAPVLTPTSSKFHSASARQKVIVLSVWNSRPLYIKNAATINTFESISWTSKKLISSYLPDLLYVSTCVVCACVWMRGKKRERERASATDVTERWCTDV